MMYIRCTQDVHKMYTRCTHDEHNMYTRCTQDAQMYISCAQDVQTVHVHKICTGCAHLYQSTHALLFFGRRKNVLKKRSETTFGCQRVHNVQRCAAMLSTEAVQINLLERSGRAWKAEGTCWKAIVGAITNCDAEHHTKGAWGHGRGDNVYDHGLEDHVPNILTDWLLVLQLVQCTGKNLQCRT